MATVRKTTKESATHIFSMIWSGGFNASGIGGNLVDRLDKYSRHGEYRHCIEGYENAMLAAACDILAKNGFVFPSSQRSSSQNIMIDLVLVVKTAKTAVVKKKSTGD